MESRELNQYTVKLNKRARKGLSELVGNRRREADRVLDEFLVTSPLARLPGKVKKLSGVYAKYGYLQYALPDGYRLWYYVDDAVNTVFVVYVGPHPK